MNRLTIHRTVSLAILWCLAATVLSLSAAPAPPGGVSRAAAAGADPPREPDPAEVRAYEDYAKVVSRTAAMVRDGQARRLAAAHGLRVLAITWEDTGRFKDSAVGPNISDMTIQVQQRDPRTDRHHLTLMPVIRHPNFSDRTGDVPIDRFFLLVGNHREDGELERITLRQLLANPRDYMSDPSSWRGRHKSLLADRDTHVLVSAQACFLPIPRDGEATFNPVVFNYQSSRRNPAVLTILVTREGTSMTVIDNVRDGFEAGGTWGQRLFFNKAGQRASLTGRRLSDFQADQDPQQPQRPEDGDDDAEPAAEAAGQEGLNMVMLIQVPLKHRELRRSPWSGVAAAESLPQAMPMQEDSDVEAAVIGHGPVEGPFTEFDNLPIQRDPRFPIRITVQFYKATSNGIVSEQDIAQIAEQIERVYEEADYVGSLVVDGDTDRPTEHDGPKVEPSWWWQAFWQRHERNTGLTPQQTLEMLEELLGPNYRPESREQLEQDLQRLREHLRQHAEDNE